MDFRYGLNNTSEYNNAMGHGFSDFMMLQPCKIINILMKPLWVYGNSRNPNSFIASL
jgi:hypothetical protein